MEISEEQKKNFPRVSEFVELFESTTELVKQKRILSELNEAYRAGNALVPDEVYDDMLSSIGLEDGLEDTMDVVIEGREVVLPITMTSLKKAKTGKHLSHWAKIKKLSPGTMIAVTPKMDGNSMCVEFINQQFTLGATRGATAKAGIGTDCTDSLKHVNNLVLGGIQADIANVVFAGELMCSKSKFLEIFKPLDYKFPRGIPAGLMRDDNPNQEHLGVLDFIKYRAELPNGDMAFLTKEAEIQFCNKYNTHQIPCVLMPIEGVNEDVLLKLFREWSNMDFEIDGLVLEVNDKTLWDDIGRETSTENPGWARAYKGKFETSYETRISDIEYNVSKYGVINPRLQLDAVIIDGNEITSTYPDNARSVAFYDMKPGDKVRMIRSGQVIPRMSEVNGQPYKPAEIDRKYIPTKKPIELCTCCGQDLHWDENFVQLMCLDLNNICSAQKLHKIIAFFEIAGIKNLSDATFNEFFNRGYNTVGKIFNLEVSEMAGWPGWGSSKAENARREILKTFGNLKLITTMHASSCFRGLGSRKLELIKEHLLDCLTAGLTPSKEKIIAINGYAEISANVVMDGWLPFKKFVEDNNLILITAEQKEKVEVVGDKFNNSVVLFSKFRDKSLEEEIKSQGGQIVDSYSKKVTCLVIPDLDATSSKVEKARKDGCKIISRDELMNMLGKSSNTETQNALW